MKKVKRIYPTKKVKKLIYGKLVTVSALLNISSM